MRAYHPAGLALAAIVFAVPAGAQTIDPGLTRAAQCSGILKGNATVDLALGADERGIVADFYLANTYFLGATKKALGSKPDDAEFLTYQEIHMAALNEVVAVHDAGEWDSQGYEDVITCYAEAGIFFIEELPDYSLQEEHIRKASTDQVANIKILFGLN